MNAHSHPTSEVQPVATRPDRAPRMDVTTDAERANGFKSYKPEFMDQYEQDFVEGLNHDSLHRQIRNEGGVSSGFGTDWLSDEALSYAKAIAGMGLADVSRRLPLADPTNRMGQPRAGTAGHIGL